MVEAAPPRLRLLHLLSASVVGLFLNFHIANHIVGLFGEHRHIAFMAAGRHVYRSLPVEAVLLGLFGWQALSGVALVIRGWRTRVGAIAWAQAASGLYLALFLCIHVTAVLSGRAYGIDTDFRFAAQGMHIGLAWFFVPYYSLAVLAIFTHLGCALYWISQGQNRPPQPWIVGVSAAVGGVLGLLIIASLGGVFFPVNPQVVL